MKLKLSLGRRYSVCAHFPRTTVKIARLEEIRAMEGLGLWTCKFDKRYKHGLGVRLQLSDSKEARRVTGCREHSRI